MTLDWLTVAAQAINFLVLVWLLKRFLYRPVMQAMEAREARIAARFATAETREREASARAGELEAAKRDFDLAEAGMMAQAKKAAAEHEQELLARAKAEIDEQSRAWTRLIEREREDFLIHLETTMAGQVCELTRAALEDLADTDLEPRIVRVFCRMLEHLPEAEREDFKTGYAQAEGRVAVQTPVELAVSLRDDVRQALRGIVGEDADIRFLTDSTMTAGIVVRAGSRSVSWTIESYMNGLRRRAEAELDTIEKTDIAL